MVKSVQYNKVDLSDFTIPNTVDAEKQVCVDLLANPSILPEVAAHLSPEMFSAKEYRDFYNLLQAMSLGDETIDIVTVGTRSPKTLASLPLGSASGVMGVIPHINALVEGFLKRQLFVSGVDLLQRATSAVSMADMNLGQIVSDLEKKYSGVGDADTESTFNVLDGLDKEVAEAEEAVRTNKRRRVSTGFIELNGYLGGGFNNGDLIVLAARPSVGKSAVALKMAQSAAESGTPALFISLEMTNMQQAKRILASRGYLDPNAIDKGAVDKVKLNEGRKWLSSLPLWFNDRVHTWEQISSKIRTEHARGRCGAAFIDYLGLITHGNYMKASEWLSWLTPQIKALAKEMHIPIILLCQLNRDSERENRSPQPRDLRDSGSIEQDADVILMLEPSEARLAMHIRKNRSGSPGTIFLPPVYTFVAFNNGLQTTSSNPEIPF